MCFSLPESDSLPELAPLENIPRADTPTHQNQHQLPPVRASRPPSCFPKNLVGKNRSSRKSDSGQDKIPKGQKKQRRYENSMAVFLHYWTSSLSLIVPSRQILAQPG